MHHQPHARHTAAALRQARAHAAPRRAGAKPKAIHAGVDLDVHVERARQRARSRASAPARRRARRWRARRCAISGRARARRRSLRAAGSAACSLPRAARAPLELEQRQSVGAVERRQHAQQAVAVRVRLDDGEHLRARRVSANATRDSRRSRQDPPPRRSGGPCGELNGGRRRVALSATTEDARHDRGRAAEGLWDHGIKRRPRGVRIITIRQRTSCTLERVRRDRFPELHETRLLHHHGGAVLFVARRQRAADRRDRAAAASCTSRRG